MPSPSVDSLHVKDQHKHNLAIKVDVEVSSPCGKNKDHLVVETHVDPTTMVCQDKFVKKDVRNELKLVDNSSEKEEDKVIEFNDIIQDGLLLPSTHKDDTQKESESNETIDFARHIIKIGHFSQICQKYICHSNLGPIVKMYMSSSKKDLLVNLDLLKNHELY